MKRKSNKQSAISSLRILGISTVFIILLISLLYGGITLVSYIETKLPRQSGYCVEWEGYLQRDNNIWGCYNLQEQRFECVWTVEQETQHLYVFDLEGNMLKNITECSRWLS